MRKSGKPDFRCHPRLWVLTIFKTWMPGTRPGMTVLSENLNGSCSRLRPGSFFHKLFTIPRKVRAMVLCWRWVIDANSGSEISVAANASAFGHGLPP